THRIAATSSLFYRSAGTAQGSWTLRALGFELIEVRLRIGLRPEADFAGALVGIIRDLPDFLAIQVASHLVTLHCDLQFVPGPRFYFHPFFASQLRAFAGHDFVDAVVVFQGVHPSNVVVVVVLIAPDETAALVAVAGDRLEGN